LFLSLGLRDRGLIDATEPNAVGYNNSKSTKAVDEDEAFFGADYVSRKLSCYAVGDNIYHCCEAEGGTSGTPSAFLVKGSNAGNSFLHCFACGVSSFIMRVHDPPLYVCKRNTFQAVGTKMEIHPLMYSGVFSVIDAPCGSGKTHNAARFVKLLHESTVVCPTFRSSLAVTLSAKGNFDLECYTNTKKRGRQGEDKEVVTKLWNRTTVCLNSVKDIPKEIMERAQPYEIVVLDEADMLRCHFVNSTMTEFARRILDALREIIRKAKTVVVMQYKLYERTVEFYATLRNIDLYADCISSLR
jgi:hypothetical protein